MSTPSAASTTVSPAPMTLPGQTQNMYQLGMQRLEDLYQMGEPKVYGGARYVTPDVSTTQALNLAETRAKTGSTLTDEMKKQQLKTLSGEYLTGSPFLEGAFAAAAKPITTRFQDEIARITSEASRAGRYGSGAMTQLQSRSSENLAEALANIGGTLAYRNYEAERARQEEAARAAPGLAQSEYTDLERLLKVGQSREAYEQAKIQADIDKFREEQMAPYTRLQTFLSGVYGAPTGQTTSTTYTQDPALQALGAALAGGTLFGSDGSLNIPASIASGLMAYFGIKKP